MDEIIGVVHELKLKRKKEKEKREKTESNPKKYAEMFSRFETQNR
jgi:hypothetical protein